MNELLTREFATKNEEFSFIRENLDLIKAQRKSTIKWSDSFSCSSYAVNERGERAQKSELTDTGKLKLHLVINASNILDSHRDLHLPGIWKKNLSERKGILYLCQEHSLTFKGIITDKVKPYTKLVTFKELGYDYEGKTEILVFEVEIEKERNEFMYDQYLKGYVHNHSIRMQYVKDVFCLNSKEEDDKIFKENWDKYYPLIANQEDANVNWFYAVLEAKIIDEGSAVPKGSCFTTPVLSMESMPNYEPEDEEEKKQAVNTLVQTIEPINITQTQKKKYFIN